MRNARRNITIRPCHERQATLEWFKVVEMNLCYMFIHFEFVTRAWGTVLAQGHGVERCNPQLNSVQFLTGDFLLNSLATYLKYQKTQSDSPDT